MTSEQQEIERLQAMLDSAIQSLDAACAVRDITEKARRELLDALQREVLARKAAEAALDKFVNAGWVLEKPDGQAE